MYETQSQTNGLHRGFDECEMQPGTGNVKTFTSNDNENFTPLATVKRWFCGAIAVLAATGILLIALAGVIIWLTEACNLPWLPFVLAGLELWFIVRMVDQ